MTAATTRRRTSTAASSTGGPTNGTMCTTRIERSDADLWVDVEFALMQMKAETVSRINEDLSLLGDPSGT